MSRMFYVVGFCSSCGTGPVGLRICGQCGTLFAMCDECDAIWETPELDQKPDFLDQPDLPCPTCNAPLGSAPARWARFAEIEPLGWQSRVISVNQALGFDSEDS